MTQVLIENKYTNDRPLYEQTGGSSQHNNQGHDEILTKPPLSGRPMTNNPAKSSTEEENTDGQDNDEGCRYRSSPLHRSIYVYPSPLDKPFPWIDIEKEFREKKKCQFDPNSSHAQFSLELMVNEVSWFLS